MTGAAVARLSWLAGLLGCCQPAFSLREGDRFGETGPELGEASACVEFDYFRKDFWGENMPKDVYFLLEARDLLEEYQSLTSALAMAQTGTLNAWKASSLYRTMYVGGHEQKFEAEGVSLVLTKQASPKLLQKSLLKLCFVDRAKVPLGKVDNVYHDGGSEDSRGIVIIPYEGYVDADKSTMSVDLLKLLEAKDLMKEHMDMAGVINIGDRKSAVAVGTVVKQFKPLFVAKAFRVYFVADYQTGKKWFEYVDLDKYEGKKTDLPTMQGLVQGAYDTAYYVDAHDKCMGWKVAEHSSDIYVWIKHEVPKKGRSYECEFVAGSSERRASSAGELGTTDCKCPRGMSVYCGPEKIAQRKFRNSEVHRIVQTKCRGLFAYCAPAPCKAPSW